MKLILLGATGMVGAGVLREALADPHVTTVLSVGRRSCGVTHPKLRELLTPDLFDVASVESELVGWDGCVWAVGVTILGRNEAEYEKITVDLTLLWARALLRLNPDFSFCYCSAAGAGGRAKWARIRHRAEATLAEMPFRHVASVRPGFIKPGPGIRSGVRAYRIAITLLTPFFPLLLKMFPQYVTTSERMGRAMVRVVQGEAGKKVILESADINRVGGVRVEAFDFVSLIP